VHQQVVQAIYVNGALTKTLVGLKSILKKASALHINQILEFQAEITSILTQHREDFHLNLSHFQAHLNQMFQSIGSRTQESQDYRKNLTERKICLDEVIEKEACEFEKLSAKFDNLN
jgi:hypothetical protein